MIIGYGGFSPSSRRLVDSIRSGLDGVALHGHPTRPLPGCASLSFAGVESDGLLMALRGVALSSGSACSSADPGPSHVLLAMGLDREQANSVLRFSLGRFNSAREVEEVGRRLVEAVSRLREANPLLN